VIHLQKVIFEKLHIDKIKDLIQSSYPKEAVALIFGQKLDNCYSVMEIITIPNLCNRHDSYSISLVDIKRLVREANNSLIGIFHSHRKRTKLSENDKKNIIRSIYPDIFWTVGTLKHSLDNPNKNRVFLNSYNYKDNIIKTLTTIIVDDKIDPISPSS